MEILVNMSQGKVAADNRDLDDDMSDAASVASEQDSVASSMDTSVFVPRVVRNREDSKPAQPSSSTNVVIDSEVLIPELMMAEGGDRVAGSLPTQTAVKEANTVNYNQALSTGPEEAAAAGVPKGVVDVTASQNVAGHVDPNSHTSIPPLDCRMLTGLASPQPLPAALMSNGQVVDISSVFDRLQAQASTPVDVVLVEQMEQGLVHVYLVPRAAPQAEGGGVSSMPSGRGEGIVASVVRGEGCSAPVQGGEEKSVPIEGGERNSLPVNGGDWNSTPSEGGKGNSVPSYGDEGHSMESEEIELSEVMVSSEELVSSDWKDALPASGGS